MSATLLDLPSKTPETFVPCASCPALQRLERELAELRREVSELRCDVGYWKSRHADAVGRIVGGFGGDVIGRRAMAISPGER